MLKRKIALLLCGVFLFASTNIVLANEPATDLQKMEALGILITEIDNPAPRGGMEATVPPSINVNPDVDFRITTIEDIEILHNVIDEILANGFRMIYLSTELTDKLAENGLLNEFDRILAQRAWYRMSDEERADFMNLEQSRVTPQGEFNFFHLNNRRLFGHERVWVGNGHKSQRFHWSITLHNVPEFPLMRFICWDERIPSFSIIGSLTGSMITGDIMILDLQNLEPRFIDVSGTFWNSIAW